MSTKPRHRTVRQRSVTLWARARHDYMKIPYLFELYEIKQHPRAAHTGSAEPFRVTVTWQERS